MANTRQAKKRARQADKRRMQNHSRRSTMRTLIKYVRQAIEEKNKDLASTAYRTAISMVDKLASKGLIHKNKAARYKQRLNAQVKGL